METAANIQATLPSFIGSCSKWRHALVHSFLYTEGVAYVAESAEAFWLIDLVASYLTIQRVREQDFQYWTFRFENNAGVAIMTDGNTDEPIVTQTIEFTDFPLPSIEFYVCFDGETWTMMLPSEY